MSCMQRPCDCSCTDHIRVELPLGCLWAGTGISIHTLGSLQGQAQRAAHEVAMHLVALAATLCMAYSTRASAALAAAVWPPLLAAAPAGCGMPACRVLLAALHVMARVGASLFAFACMLSSLHDTSPSLQPAAALSECQSLLFHDNLLIRLGPNSRAPVKHTSRA